MADSLASTYRQLFAAVAFAARAHRHQLRKDNVTPYVSHPFRVCLVLRHVFGIDDPQALMAAVLHDTVEDTNTDYDDLAERFGTQIADWVAALSKDKRHQEQPREQEYQAALADGSWQVQVCKLADIFDNLMDSGYFRPEQKKRTYERSESYLQALRGRLHDRARPAWEITARLLAELRAAEASGGASS